MENNKTYSVKVNRCPHCGEFLNYFSESSDIEKTMYSIFKLIDVHRNMCRKIKGRKKTSVSICKKGFSNSGTISEYKTNKILF